MSGKNAINVGLLSVILGVITTGSGVIYIAGSKANEIEVSTLEVVKLRNEMSVVNTKIGDVANKVERLDERSLTTPRLIAEMETRIESKLHGISTQIGLVRSDSRKGGQ